ncbi:MAG: polysaccharide biosynthesis/export family protein [Roseburia sp.]|nr:polysaccharide biosynthesis/export family protein [Roseburia sp.]
MELIQTFYQRAYRIILLALVVITVTSCRTTKHLSYMQSISDSQSGTLATVAHPVKLAPHDELEIVVTSIVPEATAEYNLPAANTNRQSLSSSTSLPENDKRQQTYIVDPEGNIDFPIIGSLHVAGMTTSELKSKLTELISERVHDPKVMVRLSNFKVNVMGEVDEPKTIEVTTERFTIFDALAAAGDMTEYGRRDNVLVIREDGDSIRYTRLDLRDASVTSSPCYYLQQNDVVIVEPNGVREANAKYNTNNSFRLSVISTIVSAVSVIASLVIAIAIK